MLTELKTAAVSGLLLGIKFFVAAAVVGFLLLWAVGDYANVRASAQYLATQTEITDGKGTRLTRAALLDECIRELITRQQQAKAAGMATVPTPPPSTMAPTARPTSPPAPQR